MRFLKPILISVLLLLTGLLAGCSQQPPRMKNQPTNVDSGDTPIELPGKKKSSNAAK
jgi:hypothetical protein